MVDVPNRFKLNGNDVAVTAAMDSPLLYALIDQLQLQGPRFGCGLAQCGACSVLLDGKEVRACVTPLSQVRGKQVTTLEGLPALYAATKKLAKVPEFTPLQQALLDKQALQCGFCTNGIQIKATELLSKTPNPSEDEIRKALDGHLCRCGTYPKLIAAIRQAAQAMSGKP